MRTEHICDLASIPELGSWFKCLRSLMSGGNPPIKRFERGEALMRRGEPADRFLVILSGTAAVLGNAKGEAPLDVGSGALLGELGLLFSGRRRRTVVATSPVVSVVGTRDELERALQEDEIGSHVASVAARRLAESVQPVPAVSRKGARVVLRPLVPADRPLYLEALGSLSPETLYTRFFASHRPADPVIQRLLDIDYIDHVAWVVVESRDGDESPLGVGRLVTDPNDPLSAEVAVAVVDAHQGRGLGELLMGTLGAVAESRGLVAITGHVLSQNRRMRALCDKANASWTRYDPSLSIAQMAPADVAALLDPDTMRRIAEATQQLGQAARLADA